MKYNHIIAGILSAFWCASLAPVLADTIPVNNLVQIVASESATAKTVAWQDSSGRRDYTVTYRQKGSSETARAFVTSPKRPPAKEADGKDDERDDDQCQQCQLPIQIQHGNEGTYEDDCFLNKGNEVAGNGRLQCRNVICQIAHDIASLALVKIGKGQGLQMTI